MPALDAVTGWAAPADALPSTQDPISQGLVALVIVAVFGLLSLDKAHRVLVVFGAVAILWLVTYLTPYRLISFESAEGHIDFNVLFLLASMMAIVGVLKSTRVFSWAVGRLLQRAGSRPAALIVLLSWFTGILSAFADNVTTVVFVTPMALEIARATRIHPVAFLLPVVMAANIGGAATLIGDPPNILIGSGAGLSFMDFLETLTAPIAVMMVLVAWYAPRYFRSELAAGAHEVAAAVEPVELEHRSLLRWGIWITLLVFVGFTTHTLTGMPVAVPAAIGAAILLIVQDVLHVRQQRITVSERVHGILEVIEREIEWPTLSFFALLFIVVGAAVETGLIESVANGLQAFIDWSRVTFGLSAQGTILFAALLLLWVSGILSAIVDNIPYVAVSIPLTATLITSLPPGADVLWWALALGACLGGNGTLVGASANVTVVGLAEKAGTVVSFREFSRFGIRVTAGSLVVSSVFITAFVYAGAQRSRWIFAGAFVVLLGLHRALRRGRAVTT